MGCFGMIPFTRQSNYYVRCGRLLKKRMRNVNSSTARERRRLLENQGTKNESLRECSFFPISRCCRKKKTLCKQLLENDRRSAEDIIVAWKLHKLKVMESLFWLRDIAGSG